MKAFEITLKVDTGTDELTEFTGRFSLDHDNYVRGVVADNNGEQSYLYGHYEYKQLVCVNIRDIEKSSKQYYFNFYDVSMPGYCYFIKEDFISGKKQKNNKVKKVKVFATIKEITEKSDSIADEVENLFISAMQRYASSKLLMSLFYTVERVRNMF